MTSLDVADLVVIGGRVLGIGTDAALEQVDPQAAETALAEAPVPLSLPDSYAAAAACARLMNGLLQHPPFPEHRERIAVAVGLQFLAVNGWQADLDPPQVAAIVVQCLASGRIEPDDMAGWLAARLSAPATYGIRMPHIRNKETLVRLPLHGPARRARDGAGMSVDGRMLARFSDHAAAAVFMARQEARRLGHGSVDPEHLMLGLIRVGEGTGVREVPREGLGAWREAVWRHLSPSPPMAVVDIGAGTGAFAAAFSDWFDLSIIAVEPSAAMRAQIPPRPGIQVLEGDASALPMPDGSADGAWLSLVIHHIPDLEAAACEIRRVLRPGAPVLIRGGFSGRVDMAHTFPWEFFPETARTVNTFPSLEQTCQAFATAGFRRCALEQVPETLISLAGFLAPADSFRHADTNMRALTEEEFLRGKERLRRAVQRAEETPGPEPRTDWLDLLVLR